MDVRLSKFSLEEKDDVLTVWSSREITELDR